MLIGTIGNLEFRVTTVVNGIQNEAVELMKKFSPLTEELKKAKSAKERERIVNDFNKLLKNLTSYVQMLKDLQTDLKTEENKNYIQDTIYEIQQGVYLCVTMGGLEGGLFTTGGPDSIIWADDLYGSYRVPMVSPADVRMNSEGVFMPTKGLVPAASGQIKDGQMPHLPLSASIEQTTSSQVSSGLIPAAQASNEPKGKLTDASADEMELDAKEKISDAMQERRDSVREAYEDRALDVRYPEAVDNNPIENDPPIVDDRFPDAEPDI